MAKLYAVVKGRLVDTPCGAELAFIGIAEVFTSFGRATQHAARANKPEPADRDWIDYSVVTVDSDDYTSLVRRHDDLVDQVKGVARNLTTMVK